MKQQNPSFTLPWVGLLACNLIWALNPAIAKVLIQEIGPVHTAWIRYVGAFLSYAVAYLARALVLGKRSNFFIQPSTTKEALTVLAIGMTTCFMTPLTQMFGLTSSTAANNAILVALEPIYIVLFAWLFLRERMSRQQVYSLFLALTGLSLLSRLISLGAQDPAGLTAASGDLIIAVAIAGEAMYSVFGKILSDRHKGPAIFGTALFIGATLLTLVVFPLAGIPKLGQLSLRGWLCVLWIGPLGTTATYLFWLALVQQGMSIGSMAVTLFIQPVVGTITGRLMLREEMNASQLVGTLLILASVGMQSWIKTEKVTNSPSLAS